MYMHEKRGKKTLVLFIVDTIYNKLSVLSMADGRPWHRAENPPYQPTCGAIISKFGVLAPPSYTKPKNRDRYPPWLIFDNILYHKSFNLDTSVRFQV